MIAIDIGGSHITSVQISDLSLAKMSGEINRDIVPIENRQKEAILDDWAKNINQTIASTNEFDGQITIAFPGPFDYEKGIVEVHQNNKFKPLEGVDIGRELSTRINGCHHIHFENDAACFGLGEYFYGPLKTKTKMIALTIGSGIGCTFVNDGEVIRDCKDVPFGGEVYHLPYKDRSADDYFSTRWFVNQAETYGLKVSGVRQLIEEANEDVKRSIFYEFSSNFFEFFSSIALKFGTEIIIIGGNIAKSWSYFGLDLVAVFKSKGIRVERSELGEKAICLGAAISMYNAQKK